MIRQLPPHMIPSSIRNGNTIQKDLLYEFSILFEDSEIKRLVDEKRAEKASKLKAFNDMMERVELTDNFFAK